MLSENNKENVKIRSNRCSNYCCVCPVSKRRKYSETNEDNINQEHIDSLMVHNIDEKPAYLDDLPNDIAAGTCISIHGFIKPECSRFAINLCSSKDPNSDIALHINPRISMRYIVRAHRMNGVWGPEETTSVSKFELERNEKFHFDIVLTTNEFLVSLNGKHICAFVYRMPLTKVKALLVEGCVQVDNVEYKKVDIYPTPSRQGASISVPVGEGGQNEIPQGIMDMPVIATLPKGFQQGWQLEIYGRVKILPSSFYINLQNGIHLWPHPLIYLHLNARFNASHGKHLFIKNSWIDGNWGQEERSIGFQFTPGSLFSMAVRRESDKFSVWIDGKMSGEYKFKGDVNKVNALYIQGDFDINYIYMKNKIDDKYFLSVNVLRPISL